MPSSDPPPQLSEEEVFQMAAALSPNERTAYLLAACEGRPAVRMAVEQLLASIEDEPFMKRAADRSASPEVDAELARLKPEEVGERIGHYKLLEQIGEGGFGVVWVAEQEKPMRRRVALKIIKLGMDTKEVIARFEQERQALAMMDHPNIAKVFDAGATQFGRPFFVMELVRGVKITDYCDQANLPTAGRLQLFITVCHAVQHAHQKGIIHRDLKPSNILVTLHDGVPVPKVIDFGVAKATQQQRFTDLTVYTQFEQMIGTPLYMSPEQAEMSGLDIDTRSDIYSLGVLLYELLVGRTPFDPEELMKAGYDEMRRVIREQEPQKPSTFLSTMALDVRTASARRRQTDGAKWIGQIRGDLDWIVMKALEKDRTRRYETANGLAKDIERHLSSEPVQARPPTQLYRFRRFAKRNKIAFAAGSAVLAALIIGLGVSTWMFFKEKQAREAQSQERKKAETEASKSRQVAQFLTDMLTGVGPSVALGRDTKMLREILDKTAERVGKDLKDQPDVEADLRSTIGDVYGALAEYQKAKEMHEKALEIRRELFGNEHLDVARSLNNLANVLCAQGKLAEAETMHREALATCRKLLGSEHPKVASQLGELALVLRWQGKFAEAEAMQRESLAMTRKLLGDEHPDVAIALSGLAFMLGDGSDLEGRDALAMGRNVLGDEHLAKLLSNSADVRMAQHRVEEAERLFREALAIQRKRLGNEHPDVANSLAGLATVLKRTGKLEEAERTFREVLALFRKIFGDEHPHVAEILNNVADTLRLQGKFAESEPLFREALALDRRVLGNEHPNVAVDLYSIALAVQKQGRLSESETLCREALAISRKWWGNDDPKVVLSLNMLADVLNSQNKRAETEVLHREALAILRRSASNDVPRLENAIEQLAEDLYRESKYAEAEALYRELLESERVRLAADDNKIVVASASLARLLAEWAWAERARANVTPVRLNDGSVITPSKASAPHERAQEAERLLRECLAIRASQPNPYEWRIGDVRSRLGHAVLAVAVTDPALNREAREAKFAEAESQLLEGNEGLQQGQNIERKGAGAPLRYKRDALVRLIRLYEAWEKMDKVAEWKQKLADFDQAAKTGTEEKIVSPEP